MTAKTYNKQLIPNPNVDDTKFKPLKSSKIRNGSLGKQLLNLKAKKPAYMTMKYPKPEQCSNSQSDNECGYFTMINQNNRLFSDVLKTTVSRFKSLNNDNSKDKGKIYQ